MSPIALVTAPAAPPLRLGLVAALRFELERQAIETTFVDDGDLARAAEAGAPLIVGPAALAAALGGAAPPPGLLARSGCLCVEPADTTFEPGVSLAGACGARFALGHGAAQALAHRGVSAEVLQLGRSESWVAPPAPARDVDVLVICTVDARRAMLLASLADSLARWRARLVLVDSSPVNPTRDQGPALAERLTLLQRSRVLVLLHADGSPPLFDALAACEAAHNGCAIVSEHAADALPMRAGVDYLATSAVSIPQVLGELLEDEDRRGLLTAHASGMLTERPPLAATARALAEAAERLAVPATRARHPPVGAPLTGPSLPLWSLPRPISEPGNGTDIRALGRAVKDMRARLQALERRLAYERLGPGANVAPPPERYGASPRWETAPAARVSALVPVYEHAHHLTSALDSLAASRYEDVEIVVVDDGSSDASAQVALEWAGEHPQASLLVMRHPVNRGLPAARNTALEQARGELCFTLDADNRVLPHGIGRLVAALDHDDHAAFAYGVVARWDEQGPRDLVSMFPWAPERLRIGNYIDAMALLRSATLRELGGYADEAPFTGGWEDYELWCRIATSGLAGAFVPEIVGRYFVSADSLLASTNLSLDDVYEALGSRYPDLMERAGR